MFGNACWINVVTFLMAARVLFNVNSSGPEYEGASRCGTSSPVQMIKSGFGLTIFMYLSADITRGYGLSALILMRMEMGER